MIDADFYWAALLEFRQKHGCYARHGWRHRSEIIEGDWGHLLISPVPGYLETTGGPEPIRNIEWVDLCAIKLTVWTEDSPNPIRGSFGGRPLQISDMTDEVLVDLQGLPLEWEIKEDKLDLPGGIHDAPLRIIRFVNPYGPTFGTDAAQAPH